MNTNITCLLLAIALGLPILSHAQRGLDIGGFYGISHYKGDLQPTDFEPLELHQARGLFARFSIDNRFAVRTYLYQGAISGKDANYGTIESIRERNLSFRSQLLEGGITFEATPLGFGALNKHVDERMVRYFFSTYIYIGVGGLRFNPEAEYQGRWVELQPLGTEGQGLSGHRGKYRRTVPVLPYGFGIRLNLTKWTSVGGELGFRKTFTDYLDDVSGQYPDQAALWKANPMSATLSYRSPEVDPAAPSNPAGNNRGGLQGNDSYLFAGVNLVFSISK